MIEPLEKLGLHIETPGDNGRYSDMESMIKLLDISPNFIRTVRTFRNEFNIKGNEFSREDLNILSEELHSDWNPKTHPYKVIYNFSKFMDHNKAKFIFKTVENLADATYDSDTYRGIRYLLPGFHFIIIEILLTNIVKLKWGYSNGITISHGRFLNPNKESVYIEVPRRMAIPKLLEKIKNQSGRIEGYFNDSSNVKAPENVSFKEYQIEMLRYGFGTGRGKLIELVKVLDKFKEKFPDIKEKTFSNYYIRYEIEELKKTLKRLDLYDLFVVKNN